MKHRGCTSFLNEDRDEDLKRVFERVCREHGTRLSMREIYELTANQPAKRYWITGRRAYEVVHLMELGKVLPPMFELRLEMYKDIYERAKELVRQHPIYTMRYAVDRVVQSRAPKFYLSAGCVKNTITRMSHTNYAHDEEVWWK